MGPTCGRKSDLNPLELRRVSWSPSWIGLSHGLGPLPYIVQKRHESKSSKYLLRFCVLGMFFGVQSYLQPQGVWKPIGMIHFCQIFIVQQMSRRKSLKMLNGLGLPDGFLAKRTRKSNK